MPKHQYHTAVQKGVDKGWLKQSGDYWKLKRQHRADARMLVAKWLGDGETALQSPKTVKKTIQKTRKLAPPKDASPKASPKPSTPAAADEAADASDSEEVEAWVAVDEDGDIDGEAMEAMLGACGSGSASASENGEERLYRIAFES